MLSSCVRTGSHLFSLLLTQQPDQLLITAHPLSHGPIFHCRILPEGFPPLINSFTITTPAQLYQELSKQAPDFTLYMDPLKQKIGIKMRLELSESMRVIERKLLLDTDRYIRHSPNEIQVMLEELIKNKLGPFLQSRNEHQEATQERLEALETRMALLDNSHAKQQRIHKEQHQQLAHSLEALREEVKARNVQSN